MTLSCRFNGPNSGFLQRQPIYNPKLFRIGPFPHLNLQFVHKDLGQN
jgi:hypothetical protein